MCACVRVCGGRDRKREIERVVCGRGRALWAIEEGEPRVNPRNTHWCLSSHSPPVHTLEVLQVLHVEYAERGH